MSKLLERSIIWLLYAAVFVAVLVLYLATAAPTITVRHGGADGGELAAVALSGGVAHPPGYPAYLILARAALLLPWGEPAARLAILSAVCGAVAAAVTAAFIGQCRAHFMPTAPHRTHALAGGYAALLLAAAPRFWSQAIIAEVYALHMAWLAIAALLVLRWLRTAQPHVLIAAALCVGLGIGTHLTLLMVVPSALLAWWAAGRPRVSERTTIATFGAFILGASMYAVLPLWSARGAVPSWGDQQTVAGWWAHVSSAEYRYLIARVPITQQLNRLGFAVRDLLTQIGPVALGLAVWGVSAGWRTFRPTMAFSGCIAACSLLFAVSYGGADGEVYLLPWIWAWCVWAGLGAASAFELIRAARPVRWLAAGALLASVLVPPVINYPRLTLHADTSERDRIVAQVDALPPNALLFTGSDADTFGVWYVQRALNVRLDILVIDTRLVQQRWYTAQVVRQLGAPGELCQVLHATARPTYAWHQDGGQQVDQAAWRAALRCDR